MFRCYLKKKKSTRKQETRLEEIAMLANQERFTSALLA